MDPLDVIDPAPRIAHFRGERLELRPLTLGDLPAFSRLVRPVVEEFYGGRHPEWEGDDTLMAIEMLELHGESIIEAAAIATGKPAKFIAEGKGPAELLDLIRAIVEINRDFFLNLVRVTQSRLRARDANGVGPTPSTVSLQPVTR
jgi:hypothetical protein